MSSSSWLLGPYIFSKVKSFRKQFLYKLWPIQLPFICSAICRIFLFSFTVFNVPSFFIWLVELLFSIFPPAWSYKTSSAFLLYFPKCPSSSTVAGAMCIPSKHRQFSSLVQGCAEFLYLCRHSFNILRRWLYPFLWICINFGFPVN